jgi:hypothetical protein
MTCCQPFLRNILRTSAARFREVGAHNVHSSQPWARYDRPDAVNSTLILTFGLISPVGNTVVGYLTAYLEAE